MLTAGSSSLLFIAAPVLVMLSLFCWRGEWLTDSPVSSAAAFRTVTVVGAAVRPACDGLLLLQLHPAAAKSNNSFPRVAAADASAFAAAALEDAAQGAVADFAAIHFVSFCVSHYLGSWHLQLCL